MSMLRPLLLGALTTLFAHHALAEPAGRALSLVGEVTVSRAGKTLRLTQGADIEAGDHLVVGDKSSLQIRFTDESIVSLRPNSELKIEDYQFKRNVETDRSALNLIKGGLRTITGAIGKGNQQNYGVKTSTATIGIRGTHYVLVICDNNCFNADGSPAQNGLFGGVTDGRIVVINEGGTVAFTQQEYFRVASSNNPAERLLAPPSFLNPNVLALRGKSGQGPAQATTRSTQDSGSSQQISTSPTPATFSAPPVILTSNTTTYSVNSQPAISSVGDIGFVEASGYPGYTNVESFDISSSQFASIGFPQVTSAAALADAARAQGYAVSYNAAAGVYWTYEAADSSDPANHFGWHLAWGDPVTNMPTSGIATYAYVGGTSPTDTLGRTGAFSGSNLTVNFGTQQITNTSAMTMSFGAAGSAPVTSFTFAANQTWSIGSNSYQPISAVCTTGCSGGSASGFTNGRFFGNGATGLAAAIAVSGVTVGGQSGYSAGTTAVFAKQ